MTDEVIAVQTLTVFAVSVARRKLKLAKKHVPKTTTIGRLEDASNAGSPAVSVATSAAMSDDIPTESTNVDIYNTAQYDPSGTQSTLLADSIGAELVRAGIKYLPFSGEMVHAYVRMQ